MKQYCLIFCGLFILTGTAQNSFSEASINKAIIWSSIGNENNNGEVYFETDFSHSKKNVYGNNSLLKDFNKLTQISEEKKNLDDSPVEKFRNPSFLYVLMPVYQSNGTIGMEMGRLNLNRIGWFGSLKANLGVTKAASPYEEIDRTKINKEEYDLGAASFSLGITKSLVYPLYLYAGGGVAYHKYYTKDEDDDVIAVNLNDESGYYLFPEAALGVQFGSMAIKGGAAYIDEEVYFNVGIGFGG